MTVYVDYAFYATTYHGTVIASSEFSTYALKASAQIDLITFGRAAGITDVGTVAQIKLATCSVADELKAFDLGGQDDGIKSESIGSHSVTYADNAKSVRPIEERLSDAARPYLFSTGLMYRGLYANERGRNAV